MTRGYGALNILLLVSTMSQPGCNTESTRATHGSNSGPLSADPRTEKQVTRGVRGRILTNTGVWSPDGRWLVYDTRQDAAGDGFNGSTIEMVNVETSEVREVYRAKNGAHCGVVTFHPHENKVVFI